MKTAPSFAKCAHAGDSKASGFCLITIGNTLRGDDGIGAALCDALPSGVLSEVCRFDLGPHTGYLSECLRNHKAAIIVDCTRNGTAPGTISIVDIGSILNRASVSKIQSCHGFSFVDELLLARKQGPLTSRIVFFGVEAGEMDFCDKLSDTVQNSLSSLVNRLAFLISVVMETLKKDA